MNASHARLFVAVGVGVDVVADARALASEFGTRHPGAARALRWVRPEQVHITVRFLGNVDAALVAPLRTAFQEGPAPAAFGMTVGALEWLPNPRRPRVLMRAVGRGADELRAVQAEVDARLGRVVVVPTADRTFRPHATLARVRDGTHGALRDVRLEEHPVSPRDVNVREVTLYSSRLSPAGPTYDAIEQLRLVVRGA